MTEFSTIPPKTPLDYSEYLLGATGSAAERYAVADLSKVMGGTTVKDYGAKGDGVTDDAPAIQAALADMASGDTLYFPPGDYRTGTGSWTGFLLHSRDNITIYGNGARFHLVTDPTNPMDFHGEHHAWFRFADCNHLRVTGLQLYAQPGCECIGLGIDNGTFCSVDHNWCNDEWSGETKTPICLSNHDYGLVHANVVMGAKQSAAGEYTRGIFIGHAGTNYCSNTVASNNRVINCTGTPLVMQGDDNLAIGNFVKGFGAGDPVSRGSGIIFPVDSRTSTNCAIVGNTIMDTGQGCIQTDVFGGICQGFVISGNNLRGNTTDHQAILLHECTDLTVTGNNIEQTKLGIQLEQCSRVTITGNNINSTDHGIRLYNIANPVTDVVIANNNIWCRGTPRSSARAINLEQYAEGDLDFIRVNINNNICRNYDYGIYLRQSVANGLMKDIVLSNNICRDNNVEDFRFQGNAGSTRENMIAMGNIGGNTGVYQPWAWDNASTEADTNIWNAG